MANARIYAGIDSKAPRSVAQALVDTDIGTTIDADDISQPLKIVIACFLAVAVYNAVELIPIICITFKRKQGLYFWSLVAAISGVSISAASLIAHNLQLSSNILVPGIFSVVGWIPMVTGQSLVLYSRLHLLYIDTKILRAVLIMIIWNAATLHTTSAVLTIGSSSSNPQSFLEPCSIFEKVQVTLFFIQEITISGIYLWKSFTFLGIETYHDARTRVAIRHLMKCLIIVNIALVFLDIMILVLEYLGLYVVQVSYKAFAYSLKLKLEICILNRLVEFVKPTRRTYSGVTEQMEREWASTLERTFRPTTTTAGSSQQQEETPTSGALPLDLLRIMSVHQGSTSQAVNVNHPQSSAGGPINAEPSQHNEPAIRGGDL